jgi:hypothetical protein
MDDLLPVENSPAISMGTEFTLGLINSAGHLLLRNLFSRIPIATVPFHGLNIIIICFHFASELLDQQSKYESAASASNSGETAKATSSDDLKIGLYHPNSQNHSGQTTSQTGQVRKKCCQFSPEGSTIACPHFAILFNRQHSLNNIKARSHNCWCSLQPIAHALAHLQPTLCEPPFSPSYANGSRRRWVVRTSLRDFRS